MELVVVNLSQSDPFLAITNVAFDSPPMGALSVPVVKNKSFFFSSSLN